jgi:signal peptidase II
MTARGKFVLITSIVFAADLLSKHVISAIPHLQGAALIPDVMSLSFVANSGIFFRLLDAPNSAWRHYLLAGLTLVPVFVIIMYGVRQPWARSGPQAALALIAGGLLGNFVDRIIHGAIIDFIQVHIANSAYYPTFNIADLAITIGMVLFLPYVPATLRRRKDARSGS